MADLVLAEATREGLLDALTELRHKGLMYRRWGLKKVMKKTKGLSLLFAGPPGTGKTMAAEAIASELGRPLHVVNYAQLENMWVGETEKNIEHVFHASLEAGAVLFFDEADAVFQRRGFMATPWMNRDVNVLLAQMENYPGVVVLATNLAKVMDRALDRRVGIAGEFPLPHAALRQKIYTRLSAQEAPPSKDGEPQILVDHRIRQESTAHLLDFLPGRSSVFRLEVDQEQFRASDPPDAFESEQTEGLVDVVSLRVGDAFLQPDLDPNLDHPTLPRCGNGSVLLGLFGDRPELVAEQGEPR